jgi:hypothetical protein
VLGVLELLLRADHPTHRLQRTTRSDRTDHIRERGRTCEAVSASVRRCSSICHTPRSHPRPHPRRKTPLLPPPGPGVSGAAAGRRWRTRARAAPCPASGTRPAPAARGVSPPNTEHAEEKGKVESGRCACLLLLLELGQALLDVLDQVAHFLDLAACAHPRLSATDRPRDAAWGPRTGLLHQLGDLLAALIVHLGAGNLRHGKVSERGRRLLSDERARTSFSSSSRFESWIVVSCLTLPCCTIK